jgi:hypothetical protein
MSPTATAPRLSLLTTFRGDARLPHLRILLRWLARIRSLEGLTDFELILVEGAARPTVEHLVAGYDWVQYRHLHMPAIFHKPLLINCGARLARGQFVMPFDVDLLPAAGVLRRHLELATAAPDFLVSGYRVQLSRMFEEVEELPSSEVLFAGLDIEDNSLLGPEDNPRALRKYLIAGERFGVCPAFPAEAFRAVGGSNEQFVGWGSEDQDLIEAVCARGLTLVRAYDLVYFHLPHEHEADWRDPALIAGNRQHLAERRRARLVAPHSVIEVKGRS